MASSTQWICSVQFSHSVMSDSLWPHEPEHVRPPCPSLTPGVYLNSDSITDSKDMGLGGLQELVMPSYHLILCHPLLPPSIFPSIKVFSKESVLCIRWAKFWSFSFSINPSNEYSGLISFRIDKIDFPIVKGVSRILSSTTNWKHQFLSAQPSLWSNSHILTWLLEKS